jgi:hypothetical protein
MANLYCTSNNTGKNFVTHAEQENAEPLNARGYPGNVWVVNDNATGTAWITKVHGVSKTKSEAQTLVNTAVASLQSAWDALEDDDFRKEPPKTRPASITLP